MDAKAGTGGTFDGSHPGGSQKPSGLRIAASQPSVLAFCFLVAIVEGLQLTSFGVAAPDLRIALHLDLPAIGLLASTNLFGLIAGAFFGGQLADRVGPKRLLLAALAGAAAFALMSSLARRFDVLLAARLLNGLAVGVIMPNVITLGANAGPTRGQVARVSLVTTGMPVAGVVLGLLATTAVASDWRFAFWFAAGVPIVLLPLVAAFLPATSAAEVARNASGAKRPVGRLGYILFGQGRVWPTLALWVAGFADQLVIFLLLGWLPTLLRAAGADRKQAAFSVALFTFGGIIGGVAFGPLMKRSRRWPVPIASHLGVVLALLALLLPGMSIGVRLFAVLVVGICAIGSQLLILGLSAEAYDMAHRSSGVGAATAVGRIGSTVGPVMAGLVLGAGAGAAAILLPLVPLIVLAGGGSVYLATRRPGAAA